jgi:hypothetical protein
MGSLGFAEPQGFAEGGRILLGSDFPDAPAGVDASFTVKLDGLTADAHKAISDRNTSTLFPRLIRTESTVEVA